MAAIQEEILDGFFTKLDKSEGVGEELVNALRALVRVGGKLKADVLVAAYLAAKKDGAV